MCKRTARAYARRRSFLRSLPTTPSAALFCILLGGALLSVHGFSVRPVPAAVRTSLQPKHRHATTEPPSLHGRTCPGTVRMTQSEDGSLRSEPMNVGVDVDADLDYRNITDPALAEYRAKLQALDKAMAEAEEARRKLGDKPLVRPSDPQSSSDASVLPPTTDRAGGVSGTYRTDGTAADDVIDYNTALGTRPVKRRDLMVKAELDYTDAGSLVLKIARPGITAGSAASGAFSVAWFSAVVPATLSGGITVMPFMLPFWLAGGLIAKTAFVDTFLSVQLTIGEFAWSMEKKYLGKTVGKVEGSSDDILSASVEVVMTTNDVPIHTLRMRMRSRSKANGGRTKENIDFGTGQSREELEVIAAEINDHLAKIQILR